MDHVASDWLQFVCQLELLLNPDGVGSLRSEFAHRLAHACATSLEEVDYYLKLGRELYDFRSSSLHDQQQIEKSSLREYLGQDNHPFPFTIIRRLAEFLERDSEVDISSRLSNRVASFEAVDAADRLMTIATSVNPGTSDEAPDGLTIAWTTDIEVSLNVRFREGLEQMADTLKAEGTLSVNHKFSVGGPTGKVSFQRVLYKTKESQPEDFSFLEGSHFSELVGDSTGVFIPLIGLQPFSDPLLVTEDEALITVPHITWRTLENRRYRDSFESILMHFPRVNLLLKMRTDGENKDAWFQLGIKTPTLISLSPACWTSTLQLFRLQVVGALVSPHKVPWTVTHEFSRYRIRQDQYRLYSFLMADQFEPILEKVIVNGQGDLQEVPTAFFRANSTRIEEGLLQTIRVFRDQINQSRVWEMLPDFRQVCRLASGFYDPTNTASVRLTQVVMAFERAFGALSPERMNKTQARLQRIFENYDTPWDLSGPHLTDSIRKFRNDTAHGRLAEASAASG